VRALNRKLVRDMWHMRGQVLAIALVLAAAMATFVLSMGVHHSLSETRESYYTRNGFADVFAGMTRAPRAVVDRVAAIPGVDEAQGTIQQYATLDFAGRNVPVRALINSLDPDGGRLNRVIVRGGRMPRPDEPGEVLVDETFARVNRLSIGSKVPSLISGNREVLTVVGFALAPDYIYAIAPGDLIADESRFGVFWMGTRALEAAADRKEAVNAIALTLERGASQADVIRKVDAVLEPYGGTGAYGREDHLSHAYLDSELTQLKAMTKVIPPVFLLVATFLVYIVLGRLIRTERGQIGLLKAFGYSSAAIGWHYLKFALVVALLSIAMGSAAGIWMGRLMTGLYVQFFRFPFLQYTISADVFITAGALSLGAAALGALGGMRSAVALSPAVAMSPPPPPVYRAGLAEQLGRKGHFSPIGDMIVRHVARWPGRSAITVVGVALSLGLLFATMQFLDASRSMLDTFFFRAQRQDLTVTFVEARNEDVLFALAQLPGVLRVEPGRALPVRISHGHRSERAAIESAPTDASLSLRIDSNGQVIAMPPSGLMLSRRLADKLAVRTGDRVLVELLGGRRTRTFQPVAAVVDEFVGERAYAAEETLQMLARDAAPVGSAQLRIDPAQRDAILRRLKDMPAVLGVTERNAALRKFEQMIDENMITILAFYIAFASAIAVGVVYNSARILFSERAHELATLRVLGYHRSEVGLVMMGELALLVLLAVPLGGAIGYGMAKVMTAMFSSDLFRLPFAPSRVSFGKSTLVVLAAAILTALAVSRRILGLDMVRVLKGRE